MSINALERRLGHEFANKALLAEALTHSSKGGSNYERLEFLGDRVLGLVVGSWLWRKYPDATEGELSRRHMALVRESSLVKVAGVWGVGEHIVLGNGEARKDSILADVVEAVLGALWVDGGLAAVEKVVTRDWAEMADAPDAKDAKTQLQEWLQGQGMGLPVYEVVEEAGPDHDKHFKVKVSTAKGEGLGEGRSKHTASAAAAQAMMQKIEGK